MVKHNNVVPNGHFSKQWMRRVKTWLDQPKRKETRRRHRAAKAAAIFPRPVKGAVRPLVQCPTVKYNMEERMGRGFTVEELKVCVNLHSVIQWISIFLSPLARRIGWPKAVRPFMTSLCFIVHVLKSKLTLLCLFGGFFFGVRCGI